MDKLTESLSVTGDVEIIVTDASGTVKQSTRIKNLVVSGGKSWIAARMLGTSAAVMSHIGIGTGNITPTLGNQLLGSEIARSAFTTTSRSNNQVTYSTSFAPGVGTGIITEAGIFNASSLGTMLCRTVFSAVNKDVLDILTINWTITIL